jgi:hypothetical protein
MNDVNELIGLGVMVRMLAAQMGQEHVTFLQTQGQTVILANEIERMKKVVADMEAKITALTPPVPPAA